MRTMKEIRAELTEAATAHAKVATAADAERRPAAERVRALQDELSAAITKGAADLPEGVSGPARLGGNRPHGMRHVHLDPRKGLWSHVFEIGVSKELRVLVSSPGVEDAADIDDEATRAAAVAAWNRKIVGLA